MNEKKSKVAIIGGAGFVGFRLSKRFKKNHTSFESYDINTENEINKSTYLNIEEPKTIKKIKDCDAIINLAAVHRDDIKPKSRYDDVNIQGSINVCNAARELEINKIIFTSSVAIYGFAPADTDEQGKPNYFNDYGRTKFLAESVYKEWQAEKPESRTLVIVRPTVIFGEGNRGNVFNLLKQIASNKFAMFGSGKNKKSMAYVENVAAFLEYSLSFKPGIHIYNYIDKPDFDMNTLISITRESLFKKTGVGIRLPAFLGILIGYSADLFSKLTSKNLPISSIRVQKFMGTTQFKSSISETGFIPPVNIKDGLLNTIRYEFIEDNSDKVTFDTE